MNYQDLRQFSVPADFRGRSVVVVQLWWLVQSTLFKMSPQFAYPFRRWLLRMFGAQVGEGVLLRPSVTVTYPWKVKIDRNAWIGDNVCLYSLGPIEVGESSVISQGSYICAGDHDHTDITFAIRGRPILIEPEVWVATDVFIAPGVTIGRGAVIGARSAVFSDMPAGTMCRGSPCKPVGPRMPRSAS